MHLTSSMSSKTACQTPALSCCGNNCLTQTPLHSLLSQAAPASEAQRNPREKRQPRKQLLIHQIVEDHGSSIAVSSPTPPLTHTYTRKQQVHIHTYVQGQEPFLIPFILDVLNFVDLCAP